MLGAALTAQMMSPAFAAAGSASGFASLESLFKTASRGLELSTLAARAGIEQLPGLRQGMPSLEEAKKEGLHFADAYKDPKKRAAADQLMLELFGRQSVAHNLRGQSKIFSSVVGAAWDYAQLLGKENEASQASFLQRTQTGLMESYGDYKASLTAADPLGMNPQFVPIARDDYVMCLIKWAKAHGLNVIPSGLENIPGDDELVIYLLYPHASLLADFFASIFDPRMFPVADATNYFGNKVVRYSGFSWLASRYGQPLINRSNLRDTIHIERLIEAVKNVQLRPGLFPHSGRVLTGFTDLGGQDRAGFYSAILDEKDAEKRAAIYASYAGLRSIGKKMIKAKQQKLKVVPVVMQGAEMAMPATTGDPPFIGPDRFGGTVTLEFLEPVELSKASRQEVDALSPEIERAVRKSMGIDLHLENQVAEWAIQHDRNPDRMRERYQELSLGAEERGDAEWSILPRTTDITRSVHPELQLFDHPTRSELIKDLLDATENVNLDHARQVRRQAVEAALAGKFKIAA